MARQLLGTPPVDPVDSATKDYVDTAVANAGGGGANTVTTNSSQVITGVKTVQSINNQSSAVIRYDNLNSHIFSAGQDKNGQFLITDETRAVTPMTVRVDAMSDAITLNSYGVTLGGYPGASTTPNVGDASDQLANTRFVTNSLNTKANLASPALTGIPTAPTAALRTNTTQVATTAFVVARVPVISVGTTAPSSPSTGDLWVDIS